QDGAVQHAGLAYVDAVSRAARDLVGNLHARYVLANEPELARWLELLRGEVGRRGRHLCERRDLSVGKLPARGLVDDLMRLGSKLASRHTELLRGVLHHDLARLHAGEAHELIVAARGARSAGKHVA